ncbi:MAG: alkaline phosphatase family protein [Candidatus Brocadiales bacterium]|nr:alkaline phosphatase family protein [Candidatus Brocadiales bacterium]
MGNRVIVIGIDGGTWKIIDPLLKEGKLPHLEKIVKNGVRSSMHTTIPSQTVPAWPVCYTGVNPGKLGIYHFLTDSHKDYDEGRTLTVNDLKVKTVWDYLTENNKTALSIFVPFTYPPLEINGAIVTPVRILKELGKAELMTFPPELFNELQKVLEINIGTLAEQKGKIEKMKDEFTHVNKMQVLEKMKNLYLLTIKKIREGTLHLMNKYNWDFLMVVFTPVDVLQHRFWRFMDKAHPTYDPALAEIFGNAIVEGYTQVDQAIGEILQNAGDDVTLFIASDHGFTPVYKWFCINSFLKSVGLLKTKDVAPYKLRIKPYILQKILNKFKMGFLVKWLPPKVKKLRVPMLKRDRLAISEMIEWNASRAYATSFGININLRGREPNGMVPPGDYNSLVEEIRNHLYQVKDPDTGRKIISKVFTKEELYHGPYEGSAPDIQFLLSEPHYMFSKSLDNAALFKNMDHNNYAINAHHINSEESAYNAIFMAYGKHIKHTNLNNPPRIMDIVPTALYLMGLPVPEGLDGRPLTEILDEEFMKANRIDYQKIDIYKERDALLLSKEEEEKMREQLKNLGYIE